MYPIVFSACLGEVFFLGKQRCGAKPAHSCQLLKSKGAAAVFSPYAKQGLGAPQTNGFIMGAQAGALLTAGGIQQQIVLEHLLRSWPRASTGRQCLTRQMWSLPSWSLWSSERDDI